VLGSLQGIPARGTYQTICNNGGEAVFIRTDVNNYMRLAMLAALAAK